MERIKAPSEVPADVLAKITAYLIETGHDVDQDVTVAFIEDGQKGTQFDDSDYYVEVNYSRQGWRAGFGVTAGVPDLWID